MFRTRTFLGCCLAIALMATSAAPVEARPRLESICSVYGQRPIRLTGIGLVVGLAGKGDGPTSAPAIEALVRAMDLMGNSIQRDAVSDASNVAIVMLDAEIPATAVHAGQKIDVYCSSTYSAESIVGGRLLSAPLLVSDRRSRVVLATASGAIDDEDPDVPTTGIVKSGAIIEANLFEEEQFLKNVFRDSNDPTKGKVFTLLINPSHATFSTANNVALAINADFTEVDQYGRTAARAIGPNAVEVTVPQVYMDNPVAFVADVLEVGIDRPHTQARVVVNPRSNVVLVSGEASISPVVISHPNLQVQIGPPSFRALADPNDPGNTSQLRELVAALGQLQVPTQDVITIVRELQSSGKLHAQYIER